MSEPQHIPDRALSLIDRAVGFVSRIGDFTTFSLVALTGIFVFMRYVLDKPYQGTEDVLGLTLVVTVACSLAHGGRIGAHVAVDIMSMVGGRKVTRWTDIVVRVLGIVVLALLAYQLVKTGSNATRYALMTSNLNIGLGPYYFTLAAGAALYSLVLLLELIVGLTHFSDPIDPNEHSL